MPPTDFEHGEKLGELTAAVNLLANEVAQFRKQQQDFIIDLHGLRMELEKMRTLYEVGRTKLLALIIIVATASGGFGGAFGSIVEAVFRL